MDKKDDVSGEESRIGLREFIEEKLDAKRLKEKQAGKTPPLVEKEDITPPTPTPPKKKPKSKFNIGDKILDMKYDKVFIWDERCKKNSKSFNNNRFKTERFKKI